MGTLEKIKNRIARLYKTNPHVHVNVSMSNPKLFIKNEPVLIKGVYPHIFQIEVKKGDATKSYTIQYSDVLTHHIEIVELFSK